MNISEKIKFYRKEKGLTQKGLGDLIHKSSQVISNWERGYTTTINQDDITNLSKALDVSANKLLDIDAPLFSANKSLSNLPPITPKDERQLAKDLEDAINSLDGAAAMGNSDDDEDRELLKASLKQAMMLSKRIAKKKFTPKKYQKD